MKRIVFILLIAALLCACGTTAEPVVEPDARAEQTPVSIEEDTIGTAATEAPKEPAEAPEEPTDAPVETEAPQEASFVRRVVDAWTAEGLLDGFAPYSDADLLDLYGIDLSACISGAGFADAVSYVKEAVVIEADETTAKEIEALLGDHLDSVKRQFESYDPDAYALAEKAVLVREGGVVLMIVSPDAEAMKTVFEALLP